MTSDAQRRANIANAQRSTGPRSELGKALSRLNAEKHGLTRLLPPSPERDRELGEIARLFYAGPSNPPPKALEAADAFSAIQRIRQHKQLLLDQCATNIPPTASPTEREAMAAEAFLCLAKTWKSLGDYERRHASRLRRALKSLPVDDLE